MPYVDKKTRECLEKGGSPESAGELNYVITKLIDDYLVLKGELKYSHLNEVLGVLECAKLELYRRIVALYEDKKLAENGDVYKSSKGGTK